VVRALVRYLYRVLLLLMVGLLFMRHVLPKDRTVLGLALCHHTSSRRRLRIRGVVLSPRFRIRSRRLLLVVVVPRLLVRSLRLRRSHSLRPDLPGIHGRRQHALVRGARRCHLALRPLPGRCLPRVVLRPCLRVGRLPAHRGAPESGRANYERRHVMKTSLRVEQSSCQKPNRPVLFGVLADHHNRYGTEDCRLESHVTLETAARL